MSVKSMKPHQRLWCFLEHATTLVATHSIQCVAVVSTSNLYVFNDSREFGLLSKIQGFVTLGNELYPQYWLVEGMDSSVINIFTIDIKYIRIKFQ